ncbi:MAG: hypothetical protein ILP02_01580, partial [Clostridia bacterium]|nr:hypothetical protein [Clostridia bacterium]
AVSAVSLVRCRPDARGRVYAVVTKKMGDGVAAGAKVDFSGVYAFLKEAKESGKNLKEIEAVERSISFYDGVKIDRGTLSDVNNLFLRALKLAAE